jgi:hypothetical protein
MQLLIVLAYICGYAVAILVGSPLVKSICRRLSIPSADAQNSLMGAGRYIGYFERFIVVTFVLMGQYDAIALILTGKSIARFREQPQVEYYLVGTFSSLSWAILCGLGLKALLNLLADC